jgi:lipoprotein NlpD
VIRAPGLVLAFAVLVGATSCQPSRRPMHPENPPGAWYVVERGETLEQIAARAGVPAADILELNGLSRADQVAAGRLIYVLDGRAAAAAGAETPSSSASSSPATAAGAKPASPFGRRDPAAPAAVGLRLVPGLARFRWPLDRPQIGSPFGARGGRPHEGIDLPAPIGTPVYAAGDGQVVYAGDAIRGYGNLIVVQHAGDLLTVYAHNSVLLVRQGERVTAGQRVALVGQSGHATGSHLHFEVRQGQIPRDPLTFLPTSSTGGSP